MSSMHFAHTLLHSKGLIVKKKVLKDNPKIADRLAKYYEKHFTEPVYDRKNPFHLECVEAYERIEKTSNIPLEKIKFDKVKMHWKRLRSEKFLDSVDASAILLKNLRNEYLNIITILF